MRFGSIFLVATALISCGGVTVDLPEEIDGDFQIDSVLDDLRDCDTLSDTFVAVVRQAATDMDKVSEVTGGRVPAGDLQEKVDAVVDSAYFEVAERLGCNAVAQRVEMVEGLRGIDPESKAGDDLVTEVIRQMERG